MSHQDTSYLYTYSFYEEELDLCHLEMRSFFGFQSESNVLLSNIKVDPNRSPFMKHRLDIIFRGASQEEIIHKVRTLPKTTNSFKVVFVKNPDIPKGLQVPFEQRRQIEREVGQHIPGTANLKDPDSLFGLMFVNDQWVFGTYIESEPIWHYHQKKPQHYSTALNTRVARAVVNIAVPEPMGITAIDPCCGIGTVLIEALSMGISIKGSDINPLAIRGARENLIHFGYSTSIVQIKDIRHITERSDVVIMDMPYNLCSVLTDQEKRDMIQTAKLIGKKIVIVTIEPLDALIEEVGVSIVDRCIIKKGLTFQREVIVVRS
ncbi:tRNA G10 N-methylase Trm11 [Evansella vedderi]|uniref:tRNA G10 N-methylase Trm11 n=1 Tax=Evansella vedderi TaxID=38282 RepID=A0ABT9ZTW7_9BACI|nr:RNA methyltransferase [Evansella vedderi]MDQ0254691.1 tRNA G10 N-methylase Trm11 [Evansella vedderi]